MYQSAELLLLVLVVQRCEVLPTKDVQSSPVSLSSFNAYDVIQHFVLPRCEQRMEPGLCRAYMKRWHYDNETGSCKHFIYGGCGANLNNFPTQTHCQAACPDEIPCPSDERKKCYVSASICVEEGTTCHLHPDAICRVVPCSCEVEFTDVDGNIVVCEDTLDTTTITPPTTPRPDEGQYDPVLWYLIPLIVMLMGICSLFSALCFYWIYTKNKRNRMARSIPSTQNSNTDLGYESESVSPFKDD